MAQFECPPTIVVQGTEDPETICFSTNRDFLYRDQYERDVMEPEDETQEASITSLETNETMKALLTFESSMTKVEDLSPFARNLVSRESVAKISIQYCRMFVVLSPVYAAVYRWETIQDLLQVVRTEIYGEGADVKVVIMKDVGLEIEVKKRGFWSRLRNK